MSAAVALAVLFAAGPGPVPPAPPGVPALPLPAETPAASQPSPPSPSPDVPPSGEPLVAPPASVPAAGAVVVSEAADAPPPVLPPSPVAFGQRRMFGVSYRTTRGERPTFVAEPGTYEETGFGVHLRGGTTFTFDDETFQLLTGSQLGSEFLLAGGQVGDAGNFTAMGAFGARIHTFNVPFPGQIAFHAGLEYTYGEDSWWTGGHRFALPIGLRLAALLGRVLRFELDYTLAPAAWLLEPEGLEVDHLEHRGTATVAIGPIGAGASLVLAENEVRDRAAGTGSTNREATGTLFAEWRW